MAVPIVHALDIQKGERLAVGPIGQDQPPTAAGLEEADRAVCKVIFYVSSAKHVLTQQADGGGNHLASAHKKVDIWYGALQQGELPHRGDQRNDVTAHPGHGVPKRRR